MSVPFDVVAIGFSIVLGDSSSFVERETFNNFWLESQYNLKHKGITLLALESESFAFVQDSYVKS